MRLIKSEYGVCRLITKQLSRIVPRDSTLYLIAACIESLNLFFTPSWIITTQVSTMEGIKGDLSDSLSSDRRSRVRRSVGLSFNLRENKQSIPLSLQLLLIHEAQSILYQLVKASRMQPGAPIRKLLSSFPKPFSHKDALTSLFASTLFNSSESEILNQERGAMKQRCRMAICFSSMYDTAYSSFSSH